MELGSKYNMVVLEQLILRPCSKACDASADLSDVPLSTLYKRILLQTLLCCFWINKFLLRVSCHEHMARY